MYQYRHSPTGSDSWCKYNAYRANNTQTCKPGSGLPKDIIYKIGINLELRKDTEFEKCLHGKTQNANESFDSTIWERIPKILLLHHVI